MPGNNYNYGESYIMNSDRTSVDDAMGSNQLTRESLEFDTRAKTDVLTLDAPKKQTKTVKPNPKTGTLTYRQAYNKMSDKQKSKYKNYDDFAKQAKAYNMKKYGTINPTAEARKQGISKQELSKRRKEKLKTGVRLKATKNSRGQTVYVKA